MVRFRRLNSVILLLVVFIFTCNAQWGIFPGVIASSVQVGCDQTNMVSYYNFDQASGNLIDQHASDDGVVTDGGGTIYGATGKINDAFDFERDENHCRREAVDFIFYPHDKEMYLD